MKHLIVRRAALAAAALLVAACQDAPAPTSPDPGAPLTAMSPVAQDRIEAVFQRVSPEVMALPGTVFSDNDERIGKLVIGIDNMGAARAVEASLQRLGVDEADYAIELTPPIQFAATLRDATRPVVGGVQINFGNYVCTLGFNADHAGGRSFVTNSHCTSKQGGTEGTLYYQPLKSSHPVAIGTEVHDPAYSNALPGCPRGKQCRHSDASRALYAASVESVRGEIAQTTGPNNGSITVSTANPRFLVTSQDNSTKNFPIGTVVNKVGRTTGWTRGTVTRTCVNTSVLGSKVYQFCQTFVSDPGGATVVGGGDSGSEVFTITSGNNVKLIGLLWGGSSDNKQFVFSPLASVVQELGALDAIR